MFKELVKVMEYLHAQNLVQKALHFHHTADLKTCLFDDNGFWRLFNYILSGAYNVCDDLAIVRKAGRAIGEFQMQLADFEASGLHYTFTDFHNTRKRYEKLVENAVADPCGKVQEVRKEMGWLLSVRAQACRLTNVHECCAHPEYHERYCADPHAAHGQSIHLH